MMGAMQGALADKADQWNINRRDVVTAGLDQLEKAGGADREYQQQLLDAPGIEADKFFGYVHGTGQKQTTTGGGK